MLLKTVMTLGTSISNSGELNIISVLIAFTIDQIGVRFILGLAVFSTCKALMAFADKEEQPVIVTLLCFEELTAIMIKR